MSIIAELIANIIETRFAQFDDTVIERARAHVLDVMGCAMGGSTTTGCRAMMDQVRAWGGNPQATVLAHGHKAPTGNAAMVNSIMARSFDSGNPDPMPEPRTRISLTTVPTAMAVGEQEGSTGRDFIQAVVLGDDLASRIMAASHRCEDSGWDCTGTAYAFGAVAVASKLCGLDEQQMLNAFGIVFNQMAGTLQNRSDGVHAVALPQGLSCRNGIFATLLAGKGFTGIKDPLFSRHGYFSLYSPECRPEYLTKDLGRVFHTDHLPETYSRSGESNRPDSSPGDRSGAHAADSATVTTKAVDAKRARFIDNVMSSGAIGETQARKALRLIDAIEDVKKIGSIIRLLSP